MDSYFAHSPEIAMQRQKQKQTTIDNAYNKKSEKIAHTRIARWMYDAGITFNAVNYDSFAPMFEAIGQFGPRTRPPSYHQVRVPLLKKEVEQTHELMKKHKEDWAKYGCFI